MHFAHPCIHQCILSFFFGNDTGLVRRKPQLFGPNIPIQMIALVLTAVSTEADLRRS
jgi:hypothetical protein